MWNLNKQTIQSGSKNAVVKIVATEPGGFAEWQLLVQADEFQCSHFTLSHIEYSVSSETELLLAWHSNANERKVIMPLSGRGRFDFAPYGGLQNNVEVGKTGGLEVLSRQLKPDFPELQSFMIILDLDKKG